MTIIRGHGGRRTLAVLVALSALLPLGMAACASREGADQVVTRGMVSRDRELARTPDQLDLNKPAWRRDWTPTRDP